MSKKKQQFDPQHEAEMLNSPVRMDGVGEDQLIKDLLSPEFVTGTDTQVAPIAMALAELLTGQKMQAHQQEIIMKRFEKIEKAQRAWEQDKEKFLEEVDRRAQSLITKNPLEKERMQAEFAQTAKEAQERAAAEHALALVQFEQQLRDEPKEIITSPGIMEVHRDGETLVPMLVNEVIQIKNKRWVLPAGQPYAVPRTVANEFRSRQKIREMLKKRQNLMKDGVIEANEMAKKWNEIGDEYKTGGDAMPNVSG